MTLSVITITGQRQSGKTTTAINLANRLTQRHGVAYMGWDKISNEMFSPSVRSFQINPNTDTLGHNGLCHLADTLFKSTEKDIRVTDVLILDNADQYFHRATGLDDPKQHIIDTMRPLIGIKLLIMVMSTDNPVTNDPYIQASDIHMKCVDTNDPLQVSLCIESCSNKPVLYSDHDDSLQMMLIAAISQERISPNVFSLETLKKIGYTSDDEHPILKTTRAMTKPKR